mgnify:CR=1 FL=1
MATHIDWFIERNKRQQKDCEEWIEKLDRQIEQTRMGIELSKKLANDRPSLDGVEVGRVSGSDRPRGLSGLE